MTDYKNKEQVLEAMQKIYEGNKSIWVEPNESLFEGLDMTEDNYTPSTYGELTPLGVSNIIKKFHKRFMDPEAVFYDLGCGHGRVVSQVSLLTEVKKSCGVELCDKRFASATKLVDSVGHFPASTPTLINGNFLEQDYSDATIVYMDNTMYKDSILEDVTKLLPPDCVVIYQRGWLVRGDPFFMVETTYNSAKNRKYDNELKMLISKACGWTYGGGHEF